MMVPIPTDKWIRTIAAFEFFKGVMALAVASGLLALMHRDLHELAIQWVQQAHLNPAANYPGIFIEALTHLQNVRFRLIAIGAITYTTLRFVEAYGLFRQAAWAEILAATSAAIYIPFEILELMHRTNWLSMGSLLINIAVVAIMVRALMIRRRIAAGNSVGRLSDFQ